MAPFLLQTWPAMSVYVDFVVNVAIVDRTFALLVMYDGVWC